MLHARGLRSTYWDPVQHAYIRPPKPFLTVSPRLPASPPLFLSLVVHFPRSLRFPTRACLRIIATHSFHRSLFISANSVMSTFECVQDDPPH